MRNRPDGKTSLGPGGPSPAPAKLQAAKGKKGAQTARKVFRFPSKGFPANLVPSFRA